MLGAYAADWPQYLGPTANGIAPDLGINKDWNFPAIGQGDLELDKLVAFLDGKGKSVPLSLEIEFNADFTMRDKKEGDLEIADRAVADSFRFLRDKGIV